MYIKPVFWDVPCFRTMSLSYLLMEDQKAPARSRFVELVWRSVCGGETKQRKYSVLEGMMTRGREGDRQYGRAEEGSQDRGETEQKLQDGPKLRV